MNNPEIAAVLMAFKGSAAHWDAMSKSSMGELKREYFEGMSNAYTTAANTLEEAWKRAQEVTA